jgi:anti-sigma B factor antagonist/stage II sporulation protein AA (anti-sigma F factor antagonist)
MYTNQFDVAHRMNRRNNYSDLKKKIDDNYNDILHTICKPQRLDDLNVVLVKVKLERATADTANLFKDFMDKDLESNKNYVIDLTDALFMDSSFLGALVVSYKKAIAMNSKMNIILNYDKLKILSTIEPLKKILHMHASKEEALKEFM